MAEWVSLSEAAELEDMVYDTLKWNVQCGKYISKHEPNQKGGKNLVYIDVSSLSPIAQQRYGMRKKERLRAKRAAALKANNEPPWYAEVDFEWIMNNYEKKFMKAAALAGVIGKYLEQAEEHQKTKTEFCEEFCRKHTDKSSKQFRRYISRYKEGAAWADAYEVERGEGYEHFKILALMSKPRKGIPRKMTPEIQADIENIWASDLYQQNNQNVQMLYEDLCDILKSRNSDFIPSENTVRRYVRSLDYNYGNAKTLISKGEREFRRIKMMKGLRDIKKLKVMELVCADAHQFDCWVEYTEANGIKTAIRPYLVGFIDMRSRAMVGWCICKQPNAEVIKECCIHMMYPKKNSPLSGVPKVLYLDNGKDFTAETMTGQKRSNRNFDGFSEDNNGFYSGMGIEHVKRALPYQPWVKGEIERAFGTIIGKFTKRFPSYTGTLTGSKTSDKVDKDIKGMLAHGELYNMEEFGDMFEAWLDSYHKKEHNGLKDEGAKVPTPEWVFLNEKRYIKGVPPMDYAITLIGKCEVRTVYNYGVEICGTKYMNEELARYIGEKVKVRYYKECADFVVVSTMDGIKICNAYEVEMLNPLADIGDETLMEHIKRQHRQEARAKKDRALLKTPFVQRELQLPELSGELPKVVTLPQSESYKKNKKIESEKKREASEFVRAQAAKAFEKMERLG